MRNCSVVVLSPVAMKTLLLKIGMKNDQIMKIYNVLCAVLAAAFLLSCVREANYSDTLSNGEPLEITASWAEDNNSKTSIVVDGDNGHILWSPNESINVFFGSTSSGKFTSTNTAPQAVATFRGSLNSLIGGMEVSPNMPYWAVYPYNETNSCDGQSITFTLSHYQIGVADTFPDNLFPAIARGESLSLAFYNVCGGVCFSVTTEGVENVVFKSNDGSPMAGTVKVGFGEDDCPILVNILEAQDSVVIKAPQGGFIPGTKYFATVLPQTHSQGIKISLYTSTKKATRQLSGNISVHRAVFGVLDKMDEGLTYSDYFNPYANIVFADSRIKASCVAAFDTNGDGELSYAEAASVTDVSTAFTSTLYTSFDEFRYFTGVTEIPSSWMKDRTRLTSIALPKSISRIGGGAFSGCTGIRNLEIGGALIQSFVLNQILPSAYTSLEKCTITADEPYSICQDAFSGCIGLQSITVNEQLEGIGKGAFKNCGNLHSIYISDLLSWLNMKFKDSASAPFNSSGSGDIYLNNKKVEDLVIPETKTAIGWYNFTNCTSIKTVIFPEGLTWLGISSFSGCTSLESVSFPSTLVNIRTNAFLNCSKLKHIHISSIPSWLSIDFDNIGAAPFNASSEGHFYINGAEVTEITIPEFTNEIKSYAFYKCTGFKELTVEPLTPPSLGEEALTDVECPYIVFSEALDAYNESWSQYRWRIVPDKFPEPEAVDLGLSVKWASFNLGAGSPEGNGFYYAWGELSQKRSYSWGNYKWCAGTANSMTKYCNDANYGYNGYVDNKSSLDPEDDVATLALSGNWRIPESKDWKELVNQCDISWGKYNGVEGFKVKSKVNSAWLFLPASGYCYEGTLYANRGIGEYWASSIRSQVFTGNCFTCSHRYDEGLGWKTSMSVSPELRYYGCTIRPVCE